MIIVIINIIIVITIGESPELQAGVDLVRVGLAVDALQSVAGAYY